MSRSTLIISLTFGLLAAGCAEAITESPDTAPTQTAQQAVTVVPTFSIDGISELPEQLHITKIGLAVSEIRLEPLNSTSNSVVYSAVDAEVYTFDVANGEIVHEGTPIELPEPGRYLVSIRLEPVEADNDELVSSFAVNGFVAQSSLRVDPRADGVDHNQPLPDPFDQGGEAQPEQGDDLVDAPETPDSWTPFHYHSERAVFFPLNDVEFEPGQQSLEFAFDLQNWGVDLVGPISRAVERDESAQGSRRNGVDVSRHLDSSGQGTEAFVQRGRASTGNGRGGL